MLSRPRDPRDDEVSAEEIAFVTDCLAQEKSKMTGLLGERASVRLAERHKTEVLRQLRIASLLLEGREKP